MRGTDHKFSLEPQGLTKLVRDLGRVHVALGDGTKRVYDSEIKPITKMAKTLVAARPLAAGHVVSAEDIALRSPGGGLDGRHYDALIGTRLARRLAEDQPFPTSLVEPSARDNGARSDLATRAPAD